MVLEERIKAFSILGDRLRGLLDSSDDPDGEFGSLWRRAWHANGWFDRENVHRALNEISGWLTEENLSDWLLGYEDKFRDSSQITVGIIMAGNVPAVGFHDMLGMLISGHRVRAKLSSKDEHLMKFLIDALREIEPRFDNHIEHTTEMLGRTDAVIATGSDNSSRYFEYYFGKLPHIIRKNRNSVAVLTGNETKEELRELGTDIFSYYGLGCRNVSKLFVPEGYDFSDFFDAVFPWGERVMKNNKYYNNYEYHRALYLLNNENLLDNNFLLLKADSGLSSPVGTLFYEHYSDKSELDSKLAAEAQKIQCVIGEGYLPFGTSQKPALNDYPDNVNILEFSSSLR